MEPALTRREHTAPRPSSGSRCPGRNGARRRTAGARARSGRAAWGRGGHNGARRRTAGARLAKFEQSELRQHGARPVGRTAGARTSRSRPTGRWESRNGACRWRTEHRDEAGELILQFRAAMESAAKGRSTQGLIGRNLMDGVPQWSPPSDAGLDLILAMEVPPQMEPVVRRVEHATTISRFKMGVPPQWSLPSVRRREHPVSAPEPRSPNSCRNGAHRWTAGAHKLAGNSEVVAPHAARRPPSDDGNTLPRRSTRSSALGRNGACCWAGARVAGRVAMFSR
jgi:hypothetical protein